MQYEVSHEAQKRKVLIVLGVVQAAATLASVVLGRFEAVSSGITLLSAVGWAVGILLWIKIDAEERGVEVSGGLRLAIIVLGIFALCYYLFKTRGLVAGLKGIGWVVLYFLTFLIVSFILLAVIVNILDWLAPIW